MTETLSLAEYAILRRKHRKYRNEPTRVDNYVFDSKAEARRYEELILLERAGLIEKLGIHPRYPLSVAGVVIGEYEADFSYIDVKSEGSFVVEDVKGVRTALYCWKVRHMKAEHGITVVEIPA